MQNPIEPATAGDSLMRFRPLSRAQNIFIRYLGLAPQALCYRPLRGLRAKFLHDASARFAGFAPNPAYCFTAVMTLSGRTMRSVLTP